MSHDSTDLQESFFTITQDDFPAHIYMRGKLSRPPRLEILDQWMSSVVDPVFDPPPHRSRRDRCYLEPNETPSVIPTASICTGMDRWSQVWLGAMLLSPNTSTTTVAIKIYQQCLFPGETSQDGAKLSKVEAFSYVKMKNLQGREVPWSYGFYNVHRSFKFLCYLSDKTGQFKLPHGEVAIGHVMEYIPAPTCALLLEQISSAEGLPLNNSMWESMIKSMAMAICRIHKCHVSHGDVNLQKYTPD
ncbi:hypothetical protein BD410DRAFT_842443 [Rickenella mellea]|uniref:Protein kinase domain-containing protein n=1 Tax=Rickenella mellea TaxID=50990 RepID=A0A4Y7PVU9_9AGAM|nr:hypothetical protein BD410DRAFT_842443 [Rickenella mellea]